MAGSGWSVGDSRKVARGARWFTLLTLCMPTLSAIFALAWHLAQTNGWTESPRSFHVGDPFPWFWVILPLLMFGATVPLVVRVWRKVLQLRRAERMGQGGRPRGEKSPLSAKRGAR